MPKSKKQWKPRVIGDYEFDEVASAMQKMIRRGKEYEACYWAYILHHSGYGQYVWRRLIIISAEDVGNGDPNAAILVNACATNWERLHKHTKDVNLSKCLLVIQSVLYLCRCKKVREVDSLANLLNERFNRGERIEIPEIAIDPHTQQGKLLFGRFGDNDGKEKDRRDRWFDESSVVTNKAYEDKWKEDFRELVNSKNN